MKKVFVAVLCLALIACTVDQVLADINLLIGIVGAITPALGQISPIDATEVGKLVKIANDGLAAVKTDYDALKMSGATTDLQKLQVTINAVRDNLTQELAAARISDPVSAQKVTAWVNLISDTLTAVLAALPQVNKSGKVTKKLSAPLPSTKSIKAKWQSNVCSGDQQCAQLVK